jgi:ammonia channel protein AmtB
LTTDDIVSGDQTLMMLGTALVMFMTPGLAQFYGGVFLFVLFVAAMLCFFVLAE